MKIVINFMLHLFSTLYYSCYKEVSEWIIKCCCLLHVYNIYYTNIEFTLLKCNIKTFDKIFYCLIKILFGTSSSIKSDRSNTISNKTCRNLALLNILKKS